MQIRAPLGRDLNEARQLGRPCVVASHPRLHACIRFCATLGPPRRFDNRLARPATAPSGRRGRRMPDSPATPTRLPQSPSPACPTKDQDDSSDESPVVRTGDHARHAEADAVKKSAAGPLSDNAANAEADDWSWARRSESAGTMTEKSDLWPGDLCRTAHGRGRP
jgi:hypothetical protein